MDVLKFQHRVVEKSRKEEQKEKEKNRKGWIGGEQMKGEDHQKEKEKTEPFTELDKEEERIFKQEGMMGRKKESMERGKADEDRGGRRGGARIGERK
jgi:hypothetical protein